VDVIAPDGANLTESEDMNVLRELKISSTAIRKYIVEKSGQLRRERSFTPRGRRDGAVSQHVKDSQDSGHVKR
jgi:hypothetical protein